MKYVFSMIFALAISVSVYAEGGKKEAMKADAEAINSACAADAATAGCGDKKVGTGLMKCIGAYKKDHKDHKLSDGCKEAMKKMHHDRKEMKHDEHHESK